MKLVKSPTEPIAKPSMNPSAGKFDGDNPGPFGKFKRTKGKGPKEKIYDTVGPFGRTKSA